MLERFTLPGRWERRKLGELSAAIRGVTFSASEASDNHFPESIACLTTSGVQEHTAWQSRRFIPLACVKRSDQLLRVGDLLISTANSKDLVGKTSFVDEIPFDCTFGAFVTVVRPNTDQVDPYFLFQALRTQQALDYFFVMSSETTNISNLRTSDLLDYEVPYPSLEEQRRIAAILSRADRVRRLARYALELGDGYLQSVFIEMFGDPVTNPMGWDKATVDDVKADKKYACVGGPFGSNLTTEHYVEQPGVPVIRGTNLSGNDIPFHDDGFVFVSETKAESLIQNMAYPGDLLFTQRGTLGQIGFISQPANFDRYIVSQSQMKLTPDFSKCDTLYLYHFFLSNYSQSNIANRALVTGVPHINLAILKELPVLLPPLDFQLQFAVLARQFARIRAQQREQLRQAEHLFASLLDRAFSERL